VLSATFVAMSLPQWLVLKASAGSGKTYALVFHYLRLSLSIGSNESYYRHILAITFTNAAAAEMKERVIASLYALTKNVAGKESQLFLDLCRDLKIDGDELRLRADSTFNHMIHHYGQISIGTIDGFNHRLLRSFAFDLQLQQDFRVETELSEFKRDLLQELFAEVGKDQILTRYFLSFVFENMEDEKNWDITSSLSKVIDLLFDEEAQKHLPLLEYLTLEDFLKSEKILRQIIANFESALKKSVEPGLQVMRENNLTVGDFYYGDSAGLGKYLIQKSNLKIGFPSQSRVLDALEKGKITNSKISVDKKQIIENNLSTFSSAVENSVAVLRSDLSYKAGVAQLILRNIYELGLLQRLNQLSDELRKKLNLVFVSDFQKILSKVVDENPAPFIYEKIGERYHHILFDEFQDTSEMQWNNLLPLLENALSKNQFNLIVGDGKQAIYRWRNGKAGQFTQLPDLGPQHIDRQILFSEAYRAEVLPNNYRSAKNIIRFNNEFYERLSTVNKRSIETYADLAQMEVKEDTGYVKVQFYEKEKKAESEDSGEDDTFENKEGELIKEAISSCIEDGYSYRDIAILTRRKGKDAGPIQEVLTKVNIPVITQESLLLSESPSVMALVSFLKYLVNPQSNAEAVQLIKILSDFFPEKIKYYDIWTFAGKKTTTNLYSFLADRFSLNPSELSEVLPIYETAEKIVKLLEIPFDDSLEIILDQLHQFESKKSLSISGFPEWWDEKGSSLYQPGTGANNAVRIMTIHASKGLQFPVVIVPMKSSRELSKSLWVDTTDEEIPLPRAWVLKSETNFPDRIPPEFTDENELDQLDKLNLYYVATTRAESRLYIITNSKKGIINETLFSYCSHSESFTATDSVFESGSPEKTTTRSTPIENSYVLKPVKFATTYSLLQNTGQKGATVERSLNLYKSSRMGRELHDTLSMFTSIQEETIVSEKIKKRWPLMDPWMQKELVKQVLSVFDSKDIATWFQPGDEVYTEREIMGADGTIYRPDRVVIRADDVSVIDFKTGKAHVHHAEQVREYMQVISTIYHRKIRGFVAYIPDLELLEVSL
jgi:ATP-dependent exoDNAse (exonuclease V) beta subunit